MIHLSLLLSVCIVLTETLISTALCALYSSSSSRRTEQENSQGALAVSLFRNKPASQAARLVHFFKFHYAFFSTVPIQGDLKEVNIVILL